MTQAPERPAPQNDDPVRRLGAIMERLRSEDGCPWDREQSHRTLRPYVVEEAYEVCEAIDREDWDELRGELGDLGLQIVFHAALARREGRFDIDDVYRGICEKLVRRHPHVFGDVRADDAGTVLKNWEAIKRAEREAKGGEEALVSALDGVPKALPALQRAHRLQAKAARVGFDWDDLAPVWSKIHEEIEEVRAEHEAGDAEKLEGELGDLFFALVNLTRFLGIDAEQALHAANGKFDRRFRAMEARLAARGLKMQDLKLPAMDAVWDEIKAEEKAALAKTAAPAAEGSA